MTRIHPRALGALTVLGLALLGGAACDQRLNPLAAGIREPPVIAPNGTFNVRAVDDVPLPHSTEGSGTVYTLVEGHLELNPDSSWLFHSSTVVSAPDGTFISNSPANYIGKWTVTDSTINLVSPATGSIRIKGDTLFWTGPPKMSWESTLKFTLTK